MIKNIFLLLILGTLVWNYRTQYYHITLTHDSVEDTIFSKKTKHRITKHTTVKGNKIQLSHSTFTQQKELSKITILLKKGLFYRAMALYLEESTENNMLEIKSYLTLLAKTNPHLALEYIQAFLDNVPTASIEKLLIQTFVTQKMYTKAIEHVMLLKEYEYVSDTHSETLNKQLEDISLLHIEVLLKKESYTTLITFLEAMIAYDSSNSFYPFQLAKVYAKINKFEEAKELLEELQYDEEYQLKVEAMLSEMSKKDKSNIYEYTIPLIKQNKHHLVDVIIDGEPLRLIIDTGASYIYIDEDKASSLEVLQDIHLQTAGGDVEAQLCKASSMRVGDVELHNMKVTVAPFKREGIDGLLGMNFLNKFDFVIDQKQNKLYLNRK